MAFLIANHIGAPTQKGSHLDFIFPLLVLPMETMQSTQKGQNGSESAPLVR